MISESSLKTISDSGHLNRARMIVARGYALSERTCEHKEDGITLTARAETDRGVGELYDVRVETDAKHTRLVDYECTCQEFTSRSGTGPCRHILALVLDSNRNLRQYKGYEEKRTIATSRNLAMWMVTQRAHMKAFAGTPEANTIDFDLMLINKNNKDWSAELSIRGPQRAYVVQDIGEMTQRFVDEQFASYGKRLSFTHTREALTPRGEAVLDFLQRTMSVYESGAKGQLPQRSLELSKIELDELLQIYGDSEFFYVEGANSDDSKPMSIRNGDPKISLRLEQRQDFGYVLHIDKEEPVIFSAGARYVYAIAKDVIYRCSKAYFSISSFLTEVCNSTKPIRLSLEDARQFAETVVPAIDGIIEIDLPESVDALRPQQSSLQFYIDVKRRDIVIDARAVYGDEDFSLIKEVPRKSMIAGVVRNIRMEMFAREALRRYCTSFNPDGFGIISHRDVQAIGAFAYKGVLELQNMGSVYTTPEFDSVTTYKKGSMNIQVSLKSNLISLSFDSVHFSPDEVAAILDTYAQKKTFHRMENGEILNLENLQLGPAAQVYAHLGLSKADIKEGSVDVPLYNAFEIDSLVPQEYQEGSFLTWIDGFRSVNEDSYVVPDALQAQLRPYQVEGYRWLCTIADMGFGGILADDMGLGKSVQTIAFLIEQSNRALRKGIVHPSIIVCPASLVYNWLAEFERFAPSMRVVVVAGSAAERARAKQTPCDVLVTSYDLLRRDIEEYSGQEFLCQVLDEAQYIKNQATKTAKAAKQIQAKHKIALTGTPIENRLGELWSIFDYLMPGILKSYDHFRTTFEMPIMMEEDETQAALLAAKVAPFILRRTKQEVLTDLPEKWESVTYTQLEGEQRDLYYAIEQNLLQTLQRESDDDFKKDKVQVLTELMRLRQVCCNPAMALDGYVGPAAKLDTILDVVTSTIDSDQKMLIFSQFTTFLDSIADRLKEHGIAYYTITGNTPKKRRLELVNAFNVNKVPVFLISLKAGGTGLNLTGASVVIHADPWWNAAAQNQATDRAHRFGQRKTVSVHKVIARNTIEERILKLQEAKSDLADQILAADAVSITSLSRNDLIDLLSSE